MEILDAYGPWGVVAALVLAIVGAFFGKKVVTWATMMLAVHQQQEITDIYKDIAATERQRSDVQYGDMLKLMTAQGDQLKLVVAQGAQITAIRELLEARSNSRPAGV